MRLKEALSSADGITERLVYETDDGHRVSLVVVDRPEKRIVCFPSQIGCRRQCEWCRARPFVRNLTYEEMLAICAYAHVSDKRMLYSCMGQGEPFENLMSVLRVALRFERHSFALSTAAPDKEGLLLLQAASNFVKIKLQLSALCRPNISMAQMLFDGPIEVNAPLIAGLADDLEFQNWLLQELAMMPLLVKFNRFNPWDGCKLQAIPNGIGFTERFMQENPNLVAEYYETDGVDVGAGCGQME